MTDDPDMQLLDKAIESLGEHFETVQIFCTRNSDDNNGTINAARGTGNWLARFGQVRLWIVGEEERTRSQMRKENEADH